MRCTVHVLVGEFSPTPDCFVVFIVQILILNPPKIFGIFCYYDNNFGISILLLQIFEGVRGYKFKFTYKTLINLQAL